MDIVIEDDVWIGYDSIVLSGAHVGKGSVIGARSVVTGIIPPYSVYVANKVIKKRFKDDIIARLMSIDFAGISHSFGDSYSEFCNEEITDDNIESVIRAFAEH